MRDVLPLLDHPVLQVLLRKLHRSLLLDDVKEHSRHLFVGRNRIRVQRGPASLERVLLVVDKLRLSSSKDFGAGDGLGW